MNTPDLTDSDIDRFWSQVVKQENGCWIWDGYMEQNIYPRFYYISPSGDRWSKKVSARAIAYYLSTGTEYTYHHATMNCGNYKCINPEHLKQFTDYGAVSVEHVGSDCTCTGRRCSICKRILCISKFHRSIKAHYRCFDCDRPRVRELKYGIEYGSIKQMHADQNGKCAICGCEISTDSPVDHDHFTDRVRGLLCYTCNNKVKGIDDPEWMAKVKPYLKKYREPLIDIALSLEG